MPSGKLTSRQKFAYAAPIAPLAILHAPALTILPALYAKHTSISLATIGLLLTITRIFDAFTDPLIGYFSDRTRLPMGRRKPWMLAGAVLATVGAFFWFRPVSDAGWLWFLLASFAVSLGWTLVEIPHTAWLNDITHRYHDRAKVASYRAGASYIGQLVFVTAPLWPIFATTEITPEVTAAVSWLIIIMMPATIAASITLVPQQTAPPPPIEPVRFREFAKSFTRNKPFLILALTFGLSQLSSGMVGALYFFYIDAYLGILDKIAYLGLFVTLASLMTTPIWPLVIKRIDKHRVYAFCLLTISTTLTAMFFIQPGKLAFPLLAGVFSVSALFSVGNRICATALNADVVDYDELETGSNKAGNYVAFAALLQKFGVGIGGGFAFAIVGFFGFDAHDENGATAMTAFFSVFILIPILLNLVAAYAAWNFPIDKNKHQRIQASLDIIRK